MTRVTALKPIYVRYMPSADTVREGELYISLEFQTAIHKCCCGCGEEVVTPFNSAQWHIYEKDGEVTLHPSIGNWSYACRSHYFIKNNRIVWAEAFDKNKISRVQARDKHALESYITHKNAATQRQEGLFKPLLMALGRYARKIRDLIFRD